MEYTKKINIRFADIDSMGHVNNATYLSYFEEARIDYFEKRFHGEWDWQRDGIVLVKNEIEYLLPVFLNDKIEIITKVLKVGNKSFTFGYEVMKKVNNEAVICCKGLSILVSYDYKKFTSKEIPEKWRDKMMADIS